MPEIDVLCAAISANQLTEIGFLNQALTNQDLLKLSCSLKDNRVLKKINIENCDYNGQGLGVLFQRIKIEDNIKSLRLAGISMSSELFIALLSLIKNVKNLTHLELVNMNLTDLQGQDITHCIAENKRLVYLNLECNRLKMETAKSLVKMICHNQNLTELNISSNCLEEAGVNLIYDAIIYNLNLKKINVSFNTTTFGQALTLSLFDKAMIKKINERIEENQAKRFLYNCHLQNIDDNDLIFWASKVKTGGKDYLGLKIPHTIYKLIKESQKPQTLNGETLNFDSILTTPSGSVSSFFGQSKKYRDKTLQAIRDKTITIDTPSF